MRSMESERNRIISNVQLNKFSFKPPQKLHTHTQTQTLLTLNSSFAVWHMDLVGQTNVVHTDLVRPISDVWQSFHLVYPWRRDQCIPVTNSRHCTLLSPITCFVSLSPHHSVSPLWWLISKQHSDVNGCSVLQGNVLH